MLVKPLSTQKQRPYALIVPGYRMMDVHLSTGDILEARGAKRCESLFTRLAREGFVCYTNSKMADLRHTTGALHWRADIWRGQPTRMHLDGIKLSVSSLRGVLENASDPMAELEGAMRFLSDQGIRPASLSSMAWSLWRSTLSHPFQANFQAKVGKAALYGGRQSARPNDYRDHVQVDIQGAYPYAMQSSPYAASLMEVATSTRLDPDLPGIAQAVVYVPGDLSIPPLPRRIDRSIIRWDHGELEGTWTWRELCAARDSGAQVTVTRCWSPSTLCQPFEAWYDLQNEGRSLSRGSGVLKALSTSLWGMFGMTPDDTGSVRWLDEAGEHPVIVPKPIRKTPHEGLAHIAAETSSRVRCRIYNEALTGRSEPAHVDTDGVIIPLGSPLPSNMGEGLGQWRVKSSMVSVQVRGPQVYRYMCDKSIGGAPCTLWHYCTAGVSAHLAPRLFSGHSTSLHVSVVDRDYVLPTVDTSSPSEAYRWAESVRNALYGPPLVVA